MLAIYPAVHAGDAAAAPAARGGMEPAGAPDWERRHCCDGLGLVVHEEFT